ncbi:MAG: Putative hydrolase of the HAD superfamily [uncultured Campylobacterales bacterium]|uniref:Hydrolase of the HAD superfamily n=1 Tax=uncultured Campylobacterales bacterium TaxID=352960 RepID=A0A6S6SUF0_9BACT|nr:MAG: Putative hydrolase of the HAD superfamily [uncultured Campylobacterales bacterium]
MKYKALLLDIDNTLYSYDYAHLEAKSRVFLFFKTKFNLQVDVLDEAYSKARASVHIDLIGSGASHNRILYFQKMLEFLELDIFTYTLEIYEIYWSTFLEYMKKFTGVDEVLTKYQNKICLVTDLTAHIQHRKANKLELNKYVKKMVTSEESGHEKPHSYIFILALQKLGLNENEVCMIGDNFKKDIIGASNLGINSIWLNLNNEKQKYNNLVKEVNKFEDILGLI